MLGRPWPKFAACASSPLGRRRGGACSAMSSCPGANKDTIVSGRAYRIAPAEGFGPRIAPFTMCGRLSYLRC
jgi:hypothetical protein